MLIKEKSPILSSEITDKAIFTQRRKIIKAAAGITIASFIPDIASAANKKYAQIPIGPYSAS
ncbi:MAG: mononuclear molybdenum enzyme YedY, partial [Methyloprofundus sp.]|nr:mononuclear molybdenum enzyme YedY [Methyloprofundus sp.]